MARFRFSMVVDGEERVTYKSITENELQNPLLENPIHAKWYRQNRIETELRKWALSKLTLSYEEVTDNGKGNSDRINPTAEQQEEAQADERGFQAAAEQQRTE